MNYELCIIGGAGHVGLPLGVSFANAGVKTVLFDTNQEALGKIRSGRFPFRENKGHPELKRALNRRTLATASSPEVVSRSNFVLLVIGTPVDQYLTPDIHGIRRVIDNYFPYFRDGQVLILRSTIYPGTAERIQKYFGERKKRVGVAFCPERIAQGRALLEIPRLPQIVSAFDPITLKKVKALFAKVTPQTIAVASPIEAELAKLFSNAWRYIKFAVANQFFTIAHAHGLDYHRLYQAMLEGYPRNADLPPPGFAAGPCLLKDTMQLAAFHSNHFLLGHAAMLVNEGLPNYIIQSLKRASAVQSLGAARSRRQVARLAASQPFGYELGLLGSSDLRDKTVGILGMAFKADSDDSRDSLAYKLRNVAQAEAKRVLATDVHIKDHSFHPLSTVLRESDILILAAPHKEYASIDPRKYPNKQFIDIWGFWKKKLRN